MGVLVNVNVAVGVKDSIPRVGMVVGVSVGVEVNGSGDENRLSVIVGAASGTNSTNEIDNAPIINPTEIRATTSAFPRSRMPCINYFL